MDGRIAAFMLIAAYLALFAVMSRAASHAAGKSVWLFEGASGSDWLAANGFRMAFAIALVWPVALLGLPVFSPWDPITGIGSPLLAAAGLFVAMIGAMIAFAAQVSMGASWRVGVTEGELGSLVSGGLYIYSRNPTFAGQGLLLIGTAIIVPSMGTWLAAILFFWSASTQIRSEEAALLLAHGSTYTNYCRRVPRWLGIAK